MEAESLGAARELHEDAVRARARPTGTWTSVEGTSGEVAPLVDERAVNETRADIAAPTVRRYRPPRASATSAPR